MIEVREYVRNECGIYKIIGKYERRDSYDLCVQLGDFYTGEFEGEQYESRLKIGKLIDLIEEGDIVEYQVNSLSELKVGRVKSYRDARSNKEYLGVEGFDITKIYIKKILTKEQMEANCYTVERNEE